MQLFNLQKLFYNEEREKKKPTTITTIIKRKWKIK